MIERPTVVIGGAGMLGQALVAALSARGRRFAAPRCDELDVTAADLESRLAALRPESVINASAFTDVARAELPEQLEAVLALNRDGPARLASACRRLDVPLVHVSTDYVFDGRKTTPYGEGDAVAPLQVYGQSKLEGEREVQQRFPEALIARTSTLFGPGRRERAHYVDAVLEQARRVECLEVVRLPVSSPTYAPDLALALLDLLPTRAAGIVHTVNGGAASRFELAQAAVSLAGLDGRVRVVERPAPPGGLARPEYSVLDGSRFARLTGRSFRHWTEALGEYVAGPAS